MMPDSGTGAAEPVIVMLKPDAFTRGLAGQVLAAFERAGYTETASRRMALTAEQVGRWFLHPLPSYVDHLTSGEVTVHLMQGKGGPEHLYGVKCAIRDALGTPDRVRNLVHTADQGTEYHLLLDAFFPDLPPRRFCCAADLDLRFAAGTDINTAAAVLGTLDADGSLERIVLTLRPGEGALAALTDRSWRHLQVETAVLVAPADVPRASTFQIVLEPGEDAGRALDALAGANLRDISSWVAYGTRRCALIDIAVTIAEIEAFAALVREGHDAVEATIMTHPLMQLLKQVMPIGVTAFGCFQPNMPLMEVELRSDLARLAGLAAIGGSSGRTMPGCFSVSRYAAEAWTARSGEAARAGTSMVVGG